MTVDMFQRRRRYVLLFDNLSGRIPACVSASHVATSLKLGTPPLAIASILKSQRFTIPKPLFGFRVYHALKIINLARKVKCLSRVNDQPPMNELNVRHAA
jgi:hypothetical protein